MSLTDPRPALADASTFVAYLTGLAGLGQLVHALAGQTGTTTQEADDFVHVLLGLAGLAERVEQLAASSQAGIPTAAGTAAFPHSGRWLR